VATRNSVATQVGNARLIEPSAMASCEGKFEQNCGPLAAAAEEKRATASAGVCATTNSEGTTCETTISIEFVARPNESHRVHALLPAAITGTLEGVTGFTGCAVMASNQEERLITVLTFWQGNLSASAAALNAGWICKLSERYMDRRLRVQTMRTHFAMSALRRADIERDGLRVPVA
jgi:hypothetical protein